MLPGPRVILMVALASLATAMPSKAPNDIYEDDTGKPPILPNPPGKGVPHEVKGNCQRTTQTCHFRDYKTYNCSASWPCAADNDKCGVYIFHEPHFWVHCGKGHGKASATALELSPTPGPYPDPPGTSPVPPPAEGKGGRKGWRKGKGKKKDQEDDGGLE